MMLRDNLKKYRKSKGYTQEDIAKLLSDYLGEDIKKGTVSKWESNGASPRLHIISALAHILDIPEQFLFDDSKKAIDKIVKSAMPNFRHVIEHTTKIPLLDGYIGAGSSSYLDDLEVIDYLYIDNNYILDAFKKKEVNAIRVIGDSMSPYVNPDDIVLFSFLEPNFSHSCGKYIIETSNGLMVKNVSFKMNGDIIISSENKSYSDEVIKCCSQEYLKIIGIVVGRILRS